MPAPLEVFELVGAGPTRRRLQASVSRGLTRFVGREPEFEALQQALRRVQGGHGQVVAVIGEPGMGKSRLYHEFIRAPWTDGWLILEADAVSYGEAMAYLPVIDLLKAYAKIEAHDPASRIRDKLVSTLLSAGRCPGTDAAGAAGLARCAVRRRTSWQALDPSQRRQRTLESLIQVLAVRARSALSSWSLKISSGSTPRRRPFLTA